MIHITIFNKRIRFLREKSNLSQKELAEKLGISNVVLSRYENGDRKPDYEMLVKIAEYFNVSTDYLLGRSDTPSLTNEEEFHAFLNNPDLELWYKELPENDEEDLEALKQMWEIIKKNKK